MTIKPWKYSSGVWKQGYTIQCVCVQSITKCIHMMTWPRGCMHDHGTCRLLVHTGIVITLLFLYSCNNYGIDIIHCYLLLCRSGMWTTPLITCHSRPSTCTSPCGLKSQLATTSLGTRKNRQSSKEVQYWSSHGGTLLPQPLPRRVQTVPRSQCHGFLPD